MNKLLEELKEKREYHVARVKDLTEDIAVAQRMIVDEEEAIADLDKAIAALSTEPEEGLFDPKSPSVDDEVRTQADGAAPLLWCMHELAQDELYAAPSFEEAAAVADWANETFKQRDENDPRMRFQIELWPYSAEAHATGLVEWAKGWATKRNGDPIDWINNPPKAAPRTITGVERTSDESQATDQDRVEQADALLENQPGVSSQASSGEARACTCHPDDAVTPCPQKFAAGECRAAVEHEPALALEWTDFFADDGELPPSPSGYRVETFHDYINDIWSYRHAAYVEPTPPEGLNEHELGVWRTQNTIPLEWTEHHGDDDPPHRAGFILHMGDNLQYTPGFWYEPEDVAQKYRELDSQEIQPASNEQEQKDEGLPVLDAEPSPILRSEVPPASPTYVAPSGDEFATINGQTHLIVSDEQEAEGQAETAPAAAYAAINKEEEPAGDAAVFARGPEREKELIAEADALEPEVRRFSLAGLFGKKEPA